MAEATMTEKYPTWRKVESGHWESTEQLGGTPDFIATQQGRSLGWRLKWRASKQAIVGFATIAEVMDYVEGMVKDMDENPVYQPGTPQERVSRMKRPELEKLAHDMPYLRQSNKSEIIAWLTLYRPEALTEKPATAATVCMHCGVVLTLADGTVSRWLDPIGEHVGWGGPAEMPSHIHEPAGSAT